MGLVNIVSAVVEGLGEDAAARWFGSFNYALRGRPIVLCESSAGRDKIVAFIDGGKPVDWWATNAEPEER